MKVFLPMASAGLLTLFAGAPAQAQSLTSTHWRAVEISADGKTLKLAGEERAMTALQFDARKKTFSATGGCRPMNGSFVLRGDALKLENIQSPAYTCPDAADAREHVLIQVLNTTVKYRIAAARLELLDARGVVVARLEVAPSKWKRQ